MARDEQDFLSRWSRLKREDAAKVVAPPEQARLDASLPVAKDAPAPALPPVESLTLESDFRAFLQPGVDAGLRRAALKKLFNDPRFHFDQMDKLDTYIDDYTQFEPISEEMLKTLDHAREVLADKTQPAPPAAPASGADAAQTQTEAAPKPNDDPRQDA